MLTIDLEKELLNYSTKRELSDEKYLKDSPDAVEYLRHKNNSKEILSRFGTSSVLRNLETRTKRIMDMKEKYSSETCKKIFSFQDIQNICSKYRLRFLGIDLYKGSIADDVPSKIEAFENSELFKTFSENFKKKDNYYSSNNRYMIVAPAESFILSERPKDPLLFYSTGDGFWYLVCKWGNDLSISRYLKARVIDNLHIITPIISVLLILSNIKLATYLEWPIYMGLISVFGTIGLLISNIIFFSNDMFPSKSKDVMMLSGYFK